MEHTRQAKARFRYNLLITGIVGLAVCGLATAGCVLVIEQGVLPILLPYPVVVVLFGLSFGVLSVAEIPMMVFAMRRLVVERQSNHRLVWALNALFVSFAAVYAAPVLLITGNQNWGLALAALGVVRFIASMLFVTYPINEPGPESPAAGREDAAPDEPADEAPGEPADEAPGEPVGETPREPVGETPREPADETPGQPAGETPGEPEAEIPGFGDNEA